MEHKKRVYTFGAGKAEGRADMRNELGGKGANLAEMNLIGVPVPPGFTISQSRPTLVMITMKLANRRSLNCCVPMLKKRCMALKN